MTEFIPKPGHVLRYAYLWHEEAARGLDEGQKNRPCAVVLATETVAGLEVILLPITHTAPRDPTEAVELPLATKRRLGLDDARSWIALTEVNRFLWPGFDIRPKPGQGTQTACLGLLPYNFFEHVQQRLQAYITQRKLRVTDRTD